MTGRRSVTVVAVVLALSMTTAARAQTRAVPSQWVEVNAASSSLVELVRDAKRVTSRDALWLGYTFTLRDDVHIGCEGWRGRNISFGSESVSFHIDGEDDAWSSSCDQDFGLFLRFESDATQVLEARLLTLRRAESRLQGTIVWAGEVPVDDSVSWLRPLVLATGRGLQAAGTEQLETRTRLLTAIVVHDSREGINVAFATLDPQHPAKLRESSVFWVAQFGGDSGLQQLIDLARGDTDAEVRKQSIFWLAQVAGERATEHLAEIAEDDPDTEVRKTAVFALSQSEDDAAVDALIDIVRTHDNREVVKSALFWLGQSGDDRAVALIEELLFGRTR